MSAHLYWLMIRNNSSFLLKKRGVNVPFSTETNNLTNKNTYRYNGLVHKKTVAIVAAPDNKGFTVVTKKPRFNNAPAKSLLKVTMKAGPRRSLYKLKNVMKKNRYRSDLTKAALRRASAIHRSQQPVHPKRLRAAPKKAE